MSLTKGVLIGAGALIGAGLIFSLAMIPLGKPTLWGLVGAPKIVNTENLVRADGADYSWTVYRNDDETGLLPCGDNLDTEDKKTAAFCSKGGAIRFETISESTRDLLVGGTHYRFECTPGSSVKGALLQCELDPLGSLFH